jgi:hypothetical protein
MGYVLKLLSIFLLFGAGCVSDQKLNPIGETNGEPTETTPVDVVIPIDVDETDTGEPEPDPPPPPPPTYPDIEVTPAIIDFGNLNADGEIGAEVVTVTNVGDATLNIQEIKYDLGGSVYTLTGIGDTTIEPGDESQFVATYDPATYETNLDAILIKSNDPDESVVRIPVLGNGSAPVIDLYPDYYDFGVTYIGCDEYTTIAISNVGNVDLIVNDLDYFVSYPTDLLIETNEALYGPLPWTISPGEARIVEVGYIPLDEIDDEAFLQVESNDPADPVVIANQDANGEYSSRMEEVFDQEEISAADIIFVVDNSGSMSLWQTALADNFNSFISVFISSGVDYQIGLITTDSASFVGPVITSATPDIISEFTLQAHVGTYGSPHERGLQFAKECTSLGGEAEYGSSFTRTDAKLIIIFVSDEDDHSAGMPSEYVTHFQSLKASDSLVTVHSVVGDSPTGCTRAGGTSWERADAGERYIEVGADMGGEFISICSEDWGMEMETLARDSILQRSFSLADTPFEETIEVEVDGVAVTGWTYNEEENAVYFEEGSIPAAGAEIGITYAVLSECP